MTISTTTLENPSVSIALFKAISNAAKTLKDSESGSVYSTVKNRKGKEFLTVMYYRDGFKSGFRFLCKGVDVTEKVKKVLKNNVDSKENS